MIKNNFNIPFIHKDSTLVKAKHYRVLTRSLRFVTLILTLTLTISLHAEILGKFTAGTNYIWRGVTQTNDTPAISAAIEYHAEQGSYLGIWSSSTNYGDRPSYELNAYLGHEFNLSQAVIDVAVRYYYFPTGGKYSFDFQPDKWENREHSSFTEGQVGATYAGFNSRFAYSNSYLASDRPGYYLEFNYTYDITDEFSFKLHAGGTKSEAIDDAQYTASDQAITITWTNFFLTASNMPDNVDGRQSDKVRYVFGWTMVIDSDDSKRNATMPNYKE